MKSLQCIIMILSTVYKNHTINICNLTRPKILKNVTTQKIALQITLADDLHY